jgi:hypothetical protein
MVVTLLVAEAAMVELIPPGDHGVTLTPLAYQFLVSKPRTVLLTKFGTEDRCRTFLLQQERSENCRNCSVPR